MPADTKPPASTILFWNIRAGGGPSRAQPILLEILSHQPDIVALAECRPTFAGQFIAALRDQGLPHALHAEHAARSNQLVLISREPLIADPADVRPRLLHAKTPTLTITACHIPDASDRRARLETLASVHSAASRCRDEHHLIAGDFNANRTQNPGRDGTAIGRLAALGYADLWLHRDGDPDDPTWTGSRNAAARIDHAYASQPLVSQVKTVSHIHAPRLAGLSDHSLIKLRIIYNTP